LLPSERRRALHAVYAFCRFIDDIADDESIREPALLLKRWREELDRVYAGAPTRALSRALADSARRFNIPRELFEEIINGVRNGSLAQALPELGRAAAYCYRVASALGLICIEIFGYRNPSAKLYAENLGLALQLTNILRDVREDAERGRIYLPLEDLARFNVSESEILGGVYSPNFISLMDFEARRARELYALAQSELAAEDRATLLTAEAMRLIYAALLDESSSRIIACSTAATASPRRTALPGRSRLAEGGSARCADRWHRRPKTRS